MERTWTLRDAVNNPNNPNPPSFSAGEAILSSDAWVWAFRLYEYPNICACCFTEKEPRELRMCTGCKLHRYCSAECQKMDWKREHKLECAMLKAVTLRISTSAPAHTCDLRSCRNFAYSVYDLLVAKLAYKIKLDVKENVPGAGKLRPQDLLSCMPLYPSSNNLQNFLDLMYDQCPPAHKVTAELIAAEVGVSMAAWTKSFQVIRELSVPIRLGTEENARRAGTVLYQHALHHSMLAVCSDVNAILVQRGRSVTLYAAEDIKNYTGLYNLRFKLWHVRDEYTWTRATRRATYREQSENSCQCRKCAKEYEAEINPLKCITIGCTERIPSDKRALAACPQCGAINADRLERLQWFMRQYQANFDAIKDAGNNKLATWTKNDAMLKELDAAGLVHPDAHLRYLLGWGLVPLYISQGHYEGAWQLVQDLVACIRTVYPTFHDGRSALLEFAAVCPLVCLNTILGSEQNLLSKKEKLRLKSVFRNACTIGLGYVKESREIFAKLSGKDSPATMQSDAIIINLQRIRDGPVQLVCSMDYRYQFHTFSQT